MRHASPHQRWWNPAAYAIVVAVLALLDYTATAGTIYKCTAADGSVGFRDKPCDTAAAQSEVSVRNSTGFGNAQSAAEATPAAEVADTSEPAAERKDCSDWVAPPWPVDVAPPPEPDLSAYPKDADGQPIVLSGANVQLVAVTRRDAMSVQSECSAMVDGCFHKDNNPRNSYDACFKSAPRCASARPWEENKACCPEACWQRYSDLRRECVDPFSASTRVFFKDHCVPGTADLLEGRKP
jgi:hypothetical protein